MRSTTEHANAVNEKAFNNKFQFETNESCKPKAIER